MDSADVLVLDAECGLCTRAALFLKPRLRSPGSLRFLGQQSEEALSLLATLPEHLEDTDTVVLFRAGRAYVRSGAALRSALYLRWWWRAPALVALLVPCWFRDAVYRGIAKRRHRWFAPPDGCALD